MARQKAIVTRAQQRRIGSEVKVLVDGPSPEHDLVLQARLEGQAPEIDPVVFLTDCDVEAYAPGNLIRARGGRRPGLRPARHADPLSIFEPHAQDCASGQRGGALADGAAGRPRQRATL